MSTSRSKYRVGAHLAALTILARDEDRGRCLVRYDCCGEQRWVVVEAIYQRERRGRTECLSCARAARAIREASAPPRVRVERPPEQTYHLAGAIRAGAHDWWPIKWHGTETGRHETAGYRPTPKVGGDSALALTFGTWQLSTLKGKT